MIVVILLVVILNKQHRASIDNELQIRNLSFKIDDLQKKIENGLNKNTTSNLVSNDNPSIDLIEKEIKDRVNEIENSKILSQDDLHLETSDLNKVISNLDIPKEDETVVSKQFSFEEASDFIENNTNYESTIVEPNKSWFERFKEKNPDLEKFIGENLISKVGILILVLGISFFVKYAIDKDWINEPARVGIGILTGGIVMGVAHKLRLNFAAFSSVFVAGAVSIFYFTIGIAFHDYQLFSQTVAFIIMVVITIFSALVSVSYNRKELAILTLIGGFAVPFMVSSGSGNYQVLFSYIAILNVGMLIISYFKKWSIVTLLAFIFSSLIYLSWFSIEFNSGKLPYLGSFIFATLMYIIFSIAAVINNVRNKGVFTKTEYAILLINTFFYFGIGATVFRNWHEELKGLFTISLAIYNLVFSIVLYRKFGIKKDAIYFLLGLALTFITLTIPFQFNGNYITLFWACEAVLLLWLSQKSKITIFKIGGIVVQFLMLVSLIIDWSQNYASIFEVDLFPFLNKIFLTGLVVIGSCVANYFLLRKETEPIKFYEITIQPLIYKQIELIASIVIGYFVGMFEIFYQVNQYLANDASVLSYSVVYHYVFTTVLIYFLFKYQQKINNLLALLLSGINILLYLFVYHRLTYKEIDNNFFYNFSSNSAFFGHYIIVICVIYCLYALFKNRREEVLFSVFNNKISLWLFAFCITFILSNEIMVHALIYSKDYIYSEIASKSTLDYFEYESELMLVKKRVTKVGFPILWGLLSFIFLIVGIKKQIKQLRIIALALLGLTILKLFIFDINVSGPGRIIAFILLGILILVISFVYQKLNKKAAEQSKKQSDEENS